MSLKRDNRGLITMKRCVHFKTPPQVLEKSTADSSIMPDGWVKPPENQMSVALTRQFLETQGPKVNNALLEVKSHFNTSLSAYELDEIHELRETLEGVERQAPQLLSAGLNIKDCSWQDVLVQFQRAQDAANDSERKGKKFHHRIFREIGASAAVAIPAMDAFPDDLAILHGALAVIFSIAQQRHQDRMKLLKAFGNMPQIIYMAMSKAEHFPPDETKPETTRLHQSIASLRVTLLKVLPALIERLVPGTLFRKALNSFKGFDIDVLLDAIAGAVDRVRMCAEHLAEGVVVDTHKVAIENQSIGMQILELTNSRTRETSEGIFALQEKLDEVLKLRETLERGIDALKLERKLNAIEAKNGYLQFFQEYSKPTLESSRYLQTSYEGEKRPTNAEYTLSQLLNGLLNILDAHSRWLEDEYAVIRRGLSFDDASLAQAATMATAREVQQLLQAPQSGMVVVDGCGDRAQMSGAISPISFVCAHLSRLLRKDTQSATLTYFCGQHLAPEDDLWGPEGMLRSLMSQLILHLVNRGWVSDNLSTSATPSWFWEAINRLDLEDLCRLFQWLLSLVLEWVDVVCILDGVSYYEAQQWRNDYYVVLDCFNAVIRDRYLRRHFKLLLTSPTTNRQLPPQIMHERVSVRSSGAVMTRDFERSLRRTMEMS